MRNFVFIFILGLVINVSCYNLNGSLNKSLTKNKLIPPGTNHLADNLFIDVTEMDNLAWLEYMYWVAKVYGFESNQFKSTLPDTIVWRQLYKDFKLYKKADIDEVETLPEYYLRHPAFQNHPLVGISFDQAQSYCVWRTNRVNEVLYMEEHKHLKFPIDTNLSIPQKVIYRLPSRQEWELAALAGFDSLKFRAQGKDKIYYYSKDLSTQFFESSNYNRFIPLSVRAIKKDKSNRYHFIGNVAEMISEEGVAKGGSYVHFMDNSNIKSELKYDEPKYWLGFRCVAEVIVNQ